MQPLLRHGGPTHSLVMLAVLFLPVILVWKKAGVPYLAATASHSLIGDYLTRSVNTRGVQLLFPITSRWYSAGLDEAELVYVFSEVVLFILLLFLLFATKDAKFLTKDHLANWLLVIPILTLAVPVLIDFPMSVPVELIIPHIVLLVMLMLPFLIVVKRLVRYGLHRLL